LKWKVHTDSQIKSSRYATKEDAHADAIKLSKEIVMDLNQRGNIYDPLKMIIDRIFLVHPTRRNGVTLGHRIIVERQAFEDMLSSKISNKAGCDATCEAHTDSQIKSSQVPNSENSNAEVGRMEGDIQKLNEYTLKAGFDATWEAHEDLQIKSSLYARKEDAQTDARKLSKQIVMDLNQRGNIYDPLKMIIDRIFFVHPTRRNGFTLGHRIIVERQEFEDMLSISKLKVAYCPSISLGEIE